MSKQDKTIEDKIKQIIADCIEHGYQDGKEGLIQPSDTCRAYAITQANNMCSLIAQAKQAGYQEAIQELIGIFKDRDPLEQYTTNAIMLELRARLKEE